jgi:SAM-dependent methyltransferase
MKSTTVLNPLSPDSEQSAEPSLGSGNDTVSSSKRDERGYNQLWNESLALTVRTRRRAEFLANSLAIPAGGRILEIGSGIGTKAPIVAQVTNCHVTGLDLSADFTARAQRKNSGNHSVDFVCSSVADLADESPSSYDAIYGDGILHHLAYDLDRSLALLHRLLKQNGSFAFIEPNKANPYVFAIFNVERLRKLAHLEPDEMAMTRTFLENKFGRCGFCDVQVSYRDFLLPGIPDSMIKPSIAIGDRLEKIPFVRGLSQSLLVQGRKSP